MLIFFYKVYDYCNKIMINAPLIMLRGFTRALMKNGDIDDES